MEQIYASRLQGYMYLLIGIEVFVACVGIGLFLFARWFKDIKMSWVSVACVGAVLLVLYFVSILPLQKDIEQSSYVEYTGAFYIEKCVTSTRGGTYIFIKESEDVKAKRFRVRCNVENITDDTEYCGRFVFSERSKCLVDMSTEVVVSE